MPVTHNPNRLQGIEPSTDLKVVERYTMVDANTINYDLTVTDPNTYARPWGSRFNYVATSPGSQLVTDEFLLGPALHHLDADTSGRKDEPDPEVSDAARRLRLQSRRRQLADLRVDVRDSPAEVIDRVALAGCGVVALVGEQ